MAKLRALLVLALLSVPAPAAAFCGFYVASAEAPLTNRTTSVVLLREGTTTVLSMQNDYHGPAEDFALVVPVPVVLHERDVHTLEREVFTRIDALGAPRLVEYWEQDPCIGAGADGTIGLGNLGTIGHGSGYGSGGGGLIPPVRVEAEFAVGEYDIVILGADEASALEEWLHAHHYRIPEGAAELLRPYVEEGMKFFVARVDVDRVRFEEGRAVLSPLRFHYESERFSLPVRLGLLSADGPQDLVVNILARHQRYEVANYENVLVPTNLDVDDAVRGSFGSFYAALFDALRERHPGAVVTEYAWGAASCDPCPPEGSLEASDLVALGADVMFPDGVVTGGSAVLPTVRLAVERAGSVTPEVARRVARRHINELRFCYEQSIYRSGSSGHLSLGLVLGVGADGAVTSARVDGEGPAEVVACFERAGGRWTFPMPEGGPTEIVVRADLDAGDSRSTNVLQWVLTRLHHRYDRSSLGEDLVFRAAEAVEGGRERYDEHGVLERAAAATFHNNFQARYVIRHPFEGTIACEHPTRGIWGGPPSGTAPDTHVAADVGTASRTGVTLASLVRSAVPELELGPPPALPPPPAPPPPPPAPAAPAAGRAAVGCGCAARSGPPSVAISAAIALALAVRRRR